ncbi:hypothetical protein UlMin_041557 [Ulmus minor]
MKPWEQHAGVISMPRFDYNAPSSLLQQSHSGFLITCTIKREKSATKEAMSILGKYVGPSASCSKEGLDRSEENAALKKRKTLDGEHINNGESKNASNISEDKTNDLSNGNSTSSAKIDTVEERNHVLSLVKLTKSGLVLFTFARGTCLDTVSILSDVINSLESGSSSSPQWCHRIFPIQATCCLNEKDLHAVVSKLVLEFMKDKANKLARPLKFAVGYNRRGMEDTEMKTPKDTSNGSSASTWLDRNSCFATVAAAVKEVIPESVVDLQSPELSVHVELIPLPRVPNGSLVVAVSVLPQHLITTKPRLCVKALVSNKKAGGGKQSKSKS